MESLFEAFKFNRNSRPDHTAFMIAAGDRSVPITWRQFADDIDATAWVVRMHANCGTVALLGENSYEWITAHIACVFSGATVVPMETSLSASEIADRLKFTGAISLVHSALYAEKAKEAVKLSPGVQIAEFGSRRSEEYINRGRESLAAGGKSLFDMPPPDDAKTAMIVFTSGTTSRPKGAELTLRAMAAFCEYAKRQLKVKPGDKSLMVLPLHHIFGVCATYFMLSQSVALGVCPDFRRLYDAVERFRVNCICLVPALAEILAEKISRRAPSAEKAFGFSIDWILIGGAPLARRVYENLFALGIQPLTAYGLTETTALYSIATVGEDPHVGSAGRACDLPETELKVSDDGILLIRGPNVMKGYYLDPEGTAQVLSKDGWFRTGDYGHIDENGFVWITGRASRTIVLSSGKKIAPEEIEERIQALPGIREVLVTGDETTREISAEIYAVIPENSVKRAIASLNNTLPVHKRVRNTVIRTTPFPRTGSGKIMVPRSGTAPVVSAIGSRPAINGKLSAVKRKVKKALGIPVIIMLSLAFIAVGVSVLGLVPDLLRHEGVCIPSSLRFVFNIADMTGEILLVFFALFVVIVIAKGLGKNK